MNVLIIEPDTLLAQTYAAALQHAGHMVQCCVNAQSAVLTADQWTPDIVLLELQLVGHSGIEFLYEFRSYQEWQSIPVLVLSIVPPDEFADSRDVLAQELGVIEYLYKPTATLADICQTVATARTNIARSYV